jgi:hypothetical protein
MQQLLAELAERHYRHLGGDCYTELKIGGVGSHAWRRVQPIRAVVEAATASQQLSRAAIDSLVEELTRCEDAAFPPLVKSRGVYSFSNGVYVCRENVYVCRENAFYHYAPEGNQRSAAALPYDLAACRYVDAPFEFAATNALWSDVPTPALDALLNLQALDMARRGWMCALIGRMLYDRGDLDRWPLLLCLQGAGGRLLCKLVASFYDASDVGIVNQDLASHADKLALIVPCSDSAPLSADELKLLSRGAPALLWSACVLHWPVPNPWLVTVALTQPRALPLPLIPLVQTMELPRHDNLAPLSAELPNLLLKCNLAYLAAVLDLGDDDSVISAIPHSMRMEWLDKHYLLFCLIKTTPASTRARAHSRPRARQRASAWES